MISEYREPMPKFWRNRLPGARRLVPIAHYIKSIDGQLGLRRKDGEIELVPWFCTEFLSYKLYGRTR